MLLVFFLFFFKYTYNNKHTYGKLMNKTKQRKYKHIYNSLPICDNLNDFKFKVYKYSSFGNFCLKLHLMRRC